MAISRADIEARASAVLRSSNAMTVPVDVKAVAESLGATVRYQAFEDQVSGLLMVKDGAKHIMVNSQHHPNRQRFTIAHEIGHLVLHEGQGDRLFIDTQMRVYSRAGSPSSSPYLQAGATTTPEEERQANQFASALLMPGFLVEQASQHLALFDEVEVSTLAATFAVSEQAMSIRLQQLDLLQVDWS